MLVSASSDGEMLAQVIKYFGNCPIRGSSSHGGAQGLRQVLQFLRHDSVVFTPDGPRGPLYQVQSGVIAAAQLSALPIIPVQFEASRQWTFKKAWDQHKMAKPFSTIYVGVGRAISVPRQMNEEEFEACRCKLQQTMIKLQKKTRRAADNRGI